MDKDIYYIYVMTDRTHTDFCTGVTCHLRHTVYEEKKKIVDHCIHHNGRSKLVYYEIVEGIDRAIKRERTIREQIRHTILDKIYKMNPKMEDLSEKLDVISFVS